MGVLKSIGYLGCTALFTASIEAAMARQSGPGPSFPDRVDEICKREFANQVETAFLECKFNLLTREALVTQDEKESEPKNRLDRLYREAR
jgi:hypothetical protein